MVLEIKQVLNDPTDLYPWTHRVSVGGVSRFDIAQSKYDEIANWCLQNRIPGIALMEAYYTTEAGAAMIALKWL